jgi:hypothetical protein
MRSASRSIASALVLAVLALGACTDARTRLPFSSARAPGLVTGPTDIELTVREQTGQLVAVLVEVSNDNQRTFKQATPQAGAPQTPQFVASSGGTTAFFRWDPIKDLGPGIHRDVVLRVNSAGRDVGQPVTVTGVTVDLSDRLDPATGGPLLVRPRAVELADGSVWIVGGTLPGSGALSASGVRFDPVTGLFTPTPALTEARTGLGLARLADGAVLVAGGTDSSGAVRPTAELYRFDGTGAGLVAPAASLLVARDGAVVAPLPDGRAVVLGGRDGGGALVADVELFTPGPNGGAFSLAFSDARAARLGATATALADGRVLVIGGVDGAGQPQAEALLLDAAGAGLTSAGMGQPRAEHAAVRLPDGRVMAAGGTAVLGDPVSALSSTDIYDPVQGKFVFAPPMAARRHRPGLAYAGGHVLAVGDVGAVPSAERFDPETSVWTTIAGPSATARADAVAVATGPGLAVVVGGGVATDVYTPDAQVAAGEPFDAVRSVPAARADHTVTTLADGTLLVVGGTSRVAAALASVEGYEANARLFTPRASLLRARADHAATNIGQGLVLVVGGRDGQGVVPDAELYDPTTDRWTAAGALLTPRAGASAQPLPDGTVLVSGGVDAAGQPLASQEVWSPTTRTFSAGPALFEARADHDAVEVAGSVLVGPGQGTTGATGGADLVVPVGSLGQRVISSVGPRGRAALVAPAAGFGLVLAVGGEDAAGAPRLDLGFIDLRVAAPAWLATTRPLVIARAAPRATTLANGLDVLVTGGRGATSPAQDQGELYVVAGQPSLELGTSRRTADARQVKARARHTATLLADNRVLILGGIDERGVAIAGAELWRR